MLASAERIEEEMAAIGRQVVGRDTRLGGLLRITLPDSMASKLLMEDLVAFGEAHPQIELELLLSYSLADLSKREADVAIRLSNDPPDHLVGRRLVRTAKAIYAARSYVARHDCRRGAAEMQWIGWNEAVRDPQWVRESAYAKTPVRHRVFHSMGQLEAAKAGMGLAMLPCFMADSEPSLVRLPPGDPIADRDIWLLTHEDLRHTARVRRFLDFMADAILAKRDLIEGKRPVG
jgi:DNA-binding transcriptional LysR family regulator